MVRQPIFFKNPEQTGGYYDSLERNYLKMAQKIILLHIFRTKLKLTGLFRQLLLNEEQTKRSCS